MQKLSLEPLSDVEIMIRIGEPLEKLAEQIPFLRLAIVFSYWDVPAEIARQTLEKMEKEHRALMEELIDSLHNGVMENTQACLELLNRAHAAGEVPEPFCYVMDGAATLLKTYIQVNGGICGASFREYLHILRLYAPYEGQSLAEYLLVNPIIFNHRLVKVMAEMNGVPIGSER